MKVLQLLSILVLTLISGTAVGQTGPPPPQPPPVGLVPIDSNIAILLISGIAFGVYYFIKSKSNRVIN